MKEPPQRVVARVGLFASRSLRRIGLRVGGGVLAVVSRDSLWPVGSRAGGAEDGRRERAVRNGGGGGGDGREGRGSGEGGARYCLHVWDVLLSLESVGVECKQGRGHFEASSAQRSPCSAHISSAIAPVPLGMSAIG